METVLDSFKKAIKFVAVLPTAFAFVYGLLFTIGYPSEIRNNHMGITELVSVVVFVLFVAFGTIYALLWIGIKIYERYTGKKPSWDSKKAITKKGNGSQVSANINVDSKDFVNKNTEQTESFFNGVLNMVREIGNAKGKTTTKTTTTKPKK